MFFITGLPRCRTAWFAELFTVGEFYCHHELTRECVDEADFKRQMQQGTGNSDENLVKTDFQKWWPDAPTLIIHRDVEDVNRSLIKAGALVPKAMLEKQAEMLKDLNGLHVGFNDIDNLLPRIWNYLIGTDPDHKRIERFKNLNIQNKVVRGSVDYWRLKCR